MCFTRFCLDIFRELTNMDSDIQFHRVRSPIGNRNESGLDLVGIAPTGIDHCHRPLNVLS